MGDALEGGEGLSGAFVKVPAGFAGSIRAEGSSFRAVLIQGRVRYGGAEGQALEPGSYFSSEGRSEHGLGCEGGDACVVYVRTDGRYSVATTRRPS